MRKARADYWPQTGRVRSAVAGNIGELKVEDSPYQSVHDLQYDAGFRLEWSAVRGVRAPQQRAPRRVEPGEKRKTSWSTPRTRRFARCGRRTTTPRSPSRSSRRPRRCSPQPKRPGMATFESYKHGLATFPDVRESQRDLARRPDAGSGGSRGSAGREPPPSRSAPATWRDPDERNPKAGTGWPNNSAAPAFGNTARRTRSRDSRREGSVGQQRGDDVGVDTDHGKDLPDDDGSDDPNRSAQHPGREVGAEQIQRRRVVAPGNRQRDRRPPQGWQRAPASVGADH